MFVTIEVLKNYSARENEIKKFKDLYPNGEEVSAIVQDTRAPSTLLHWLYNYLPISKEESNLYMQRFNISNSENFINSKTLEDCNIILNSRNCFHSSMVKDSFSINNSTLVVNSRKIDKGSKIFDSKDIKNSCNIILGENISNSKNVYSSKNIYNSHSIFRSSNIFDSENLRRCEHLESSFFCAECKKSSNLMFCCDLNGEDFYIFNKPVLVDEYFYIQKKLQESYPEVYLQLFTINENLPVGAEKGYTVNESYISHYANFQKDFFDFLKALPQYDPFIMYILTLDKTFLNEKKKEVEN